jgi:hypothetical protein
MASAFSVLLLADPTEEDTALPVLTYLLEQDYFSPSPDYSVFRNGVDRAFNLVKQIPTNGAIWFVEAGVLRSLLKRHPEAAQRMQEGAAYRKQIYDGLLKSLPQRFQNQRFRYAFFPLEAAARSYFAELAAYRSEEEKRKLLEAETLAYEEVRQRGKYPPDSNVGTWQRLHQRQHTALVEKLKDEVIDELAKQDFLPVEIFYKWKRSLADLVGQKRSGSYGWPSVSPARDLPSQFATEAMDLRERNVDQVHSFAESSTPEPEAQRLLQRALRKWVTYEATAFEQAKADWLGIGDYGSNLRDLPLQTKFKWIRDLEWWQYKKTDEGDAAVTAQVEARAAKLLKVEFERDARGGVSPGLLEPLWSKLYAGAPSNHLAKNINLEGDGENPSRTGLPWSLLYRGMVIGKEGNRRENYLPPGAPFEFLAGSKDLFDPALARKVKTAFPSWKSEFQLESESYFFPSEGLIALPRPEKYDISVSVRRHGEWLKASEFEHLETPDGFQYIRMKPGADSRDPVQLQLRYRPNRRSRFSFIRNESDVPALSERERVELETVALELRAMGEVPLSGALVSLLSQKRVSPTQISDAIAIHSFYSFVPAERIESEGNTLSSFRPFLNLEGKLCFQCSGAADLLELVLGRVMKDHSNWRIFAHRVFTRSPGQSSLNTTGAHRWVGMNRSGRKVILDPTPYDLDPRNPEIEGSFMPSRILAMSIPHETKSVPRPSTSHSLRRKRASTGGAPKAKTGASEGSVEPIPEGRPETPRAASEGESEIEGDGGLGSKGSFNLRNWYHSLQDVLANLKDRLRRIERAPYSPIELPKVLETGHQLDSHDKELRAPPTEDVPISHPQAQIAALEAPSSESLAILEELQKRLERNQARRAALAKIEKLSEMLMLQLENTYRRQQVSHQALPHQTAIELHNTIKKFVEGDLVGQTAEGLKGEVEAAIKSTKLLIQHFNEPNRPLRRDRIRAKYLGRLITEPTIELMEGLHSESWSPMESESIIDIQTAIRMRAKSSPPCDAHFRRLN